MELMRHLDKTDPFFNDCYKALALQYHHTQKDPSRPNNTISFIPPQDEILSHFFFGTASPLYNHFLEVIATLERIVKYLDEDNVDLELNNLNAISDQILHEKTGIKDNFEEFIKSYTGGVANWSHFKKDKKVKPELLKDKKSGRLLSLFALAMLNRAHTTHELPFDVEKIDAKFEKPLEEFHSYFQPLLILVQTLFTKILDGVVAMADVKNPKWNTYNDIQILAAACYATYRDRNKDVKVVLVTDDNGIHTACKGTNMENNVWKVNQYLSYIY
ncbi:hypothetical protein GFS24_28190 [Chitinophaga sp. SYP-B3965]|uniref:hypothetical protein n=1 Tax=Chitinophaga sp. SYP-B3965 TaxID=2663120 RepID=UPI001299B650|nr:hypothetical protein [Chitinophaga sp. SYP-B3965]MRG49022.1 hypothetical protein [Chitinophaga sp. SYP-B3965]